MDDALALISTRKTPQSEKADARQEKNEAGGFAFRLDDVGRLHRFLMTGTQGGTFYIGERELTKDNAAVVFRMAQADGPRLVAEIIAVSEAGRAAKQNPTIFALAIAASHGSDDTRRAALAAIPRVCRTGTHLFLFAKYVELFRGWGRGLRTAVAGWYENKPIDQLTYQVVKYRQRTGRTHRDLLRQSHPVGVGDRDLLFKWIVGRHIGADQLASLPLVEGFVKAQETGADIPALIAQYRLPWEALPDAALNEASTWGALLDQGMPLTALIRQLPRLTRLGLLPAIGGRTADVVDQLTNGERLRQSRVHPMNLLVALKTYSKGASVRGSSSWSANRKIIDALDAGFYSAYGNVEPSGKRTLLALDVSGSMGWTYVMDGLLSCAEAAAAILLVTLNVEKDAMAVGFTAASGHGFNRVNGLTHLGISPRQRLDDVVATIARLPMGSTDCALPFTVAQQEGWELDAVITMTDNETWAGPVHVHQAQREYRNHTGLPTKAINVAMAANAWTVNDPNDPLGLDVAGLDASVPQVISDFSAGR